MTVAQPDRTSRLSRLGPFGPPLLLVGLMWLVEILDWMSGGRLDQKGIVSRDIDSLTGIVLSPFLHGGWGHLMANTLPLLGLGTLLALHGIGVFWRTTASVILLGGLGTWLIAPPNTLTIGASGLVFGWLAYLLVVGVRTRYWLDIVVGLGVLFLYGGMLGGALPWNVSDGVSWQAHLCGALAGGLAAWLWPPTRAPRA